MQSVSQIGNFITDFNDVIKNQLDTNRLVDSESKEVMTIAKEIMSSLLDQQIALDEIVKSMASINTNVQTNNEAAEEMANNSADAAPMAAKLKHKLGE